MITDLSIYLVTDSAQSLAKGRPLVDTVLASVAGGVTTVQVREKNASAREFLSIIETLAARLPQHVTLLVNDRVDVFLAARVRGFRVDGVHVGQSDLPASAVRAIIGPDAVLGVSASTIGQLSDAHADPAGIDYVGIGALRETTSKADAPAPLGIDRVAALARQCALPSVAIGGIVADDLPLLRAGGLTGAAVVSWICASDNPRNAAIKLTKAWNRTA